tara:strand:+ start:196 stop:609 length:414 start_codon:yes stop_codon:yes gene_type:complete
MDKKIIIEIPHQSRVKTWVAYNDADIINRAYEIGLSYELKKSPYTKIKKLYTKIRVCFSLRDYNENKEIIHVCLRDYHEGDFYKKDKAPTKLESAMDCISYDLHSCYFLSVQEAKKFIAEYRGHKKHEVIHALKEVI